MRWKTLLAGGNLWWETRQWRGEREREQKEGETSAARRVLMCCETGSGNTGGLVVKWVNRIRQGDTHGTLSLSHTRFEQWLATLKSSQKASAGKLANGPLHATFVVWPKNMLYRSVGPSRQTVIRTKILVLIAPSVQLIFIYLFKDLNW